MRTYDDPRFDEDDCFDEDDELEPDINDHRFRSPDDVREWVRRDFLMSCKAYNEVWLLDGDGAYVGCWASRSVVRVRDLAADPSRLLHATELALAEVAHPTGWCSRTVRAPTAILDRPRVTCRRS